MRYEEIMSLKNELRELRLELDILKTSEPSETNLARVQEIEKRAKSITHFIKMRCEQYGLAC